MDRGICDTAFFLAASNIGPERPDSMGEFVLEILEELERLSRQLDPDSRTRLDLLEQVRDYSENFLRQLPESGTFRKDQGRKGFQSLPISEAASDLGSLLEFFRAEADTTGITPASGGQLGYIPGGGLYPSALGDFLADISNRYSGVAFAGPGAADMELSLVNWMCDLVGYPETASGDLTSGGSIATLSAMVTARDACAIDTADAANICIYLTEQTHHCVDKALHVAGLGRINKRIVAMDERYRMDISALEDEIRRDRDAGRKPWMVVASAGTTDTGAVDPIRAVASVAKQHDLWFHLDAAYGGFFLLCEPGREQMKGIELADSIVLDPHKGLSLPYGSGAVLIRDRNHSLQSNAYYAHYMQDAKKAEHDAEAALSPADLSLELTRPFRGPRMWFPLKLFGLGAFRASIEEKLWLARYFHQEISKLDRFETGPYPDLSIVTYRYRPRMGDANTFNKRLLEAILDDGKIFISSTMIEGKYTLRVAILNFRTHRSTIDYLLALLQRKASELDGEPL
jgi:glutamate/tyrosine decarboxylase-like PLP-dependent enzyme